MNIKEKMLELEEVRARYELGGGPQAIEKLHTEGKLTVRERLELFVDPGSFKEYNLWTQPTRTGFPIDEKEIPGDAVVTGFARIDGRPICIYAHDFSNAGGSQACIQNWKVTKTIDTAVRLGIPYVGIVDSGGVRIQDAMGVFAGKSISTRADVWLAPSMANGVVPSITILLGASFAGTAYSPMLADVFFMVDKPYCLMSLASPELLKSVTFVDVTRAEIGAARMHAEISGSCDYLGKTEEETLQKARELLSFLPLNCRGMPPFVDTGDDLQRKDDTLIDILPSDTTQAYDVHDIILRLVDNGYFLELKGEYAKNIITGFARLGGHSVGIVANNPAVLDGALDIGATEKEARFIRYCDAYNVPLIFLVDTPGFISDPKQEHRGLARHAAMVIYAICEATVPKITVYTRRCYKEGYCTMGTRLTGNDLMLAWPTAQIQLVELNKAVEAVYHRQPSELKPAELEEFSKKYFDSPRRPGALAIIDEIIEPGNTRSYLIDALRIVAGKKEDRPWKKMGNIPC